MALSPQSKAILSAATDRYINYLNSVLQAVEELPEQPEVVGDRVMLPLDQYQRLIQAKQSKAA